MTEMQMRELAVRVLQIERYRTAGLAAGTADLSQSKFEAIREIDAYAMLCTSDRVSQGFAPNCRHTWNLDSSTAGVDIDIKGDGMKQGRMLGRGHGAKHPPHRRHFLGVLA